MIKCQRCQAECSWTNDTVRVRGGVIAHLCAGCQTELEGSIHGTDLQDELQEISARAQYYEDLAVAGTPVSEDERFKLVVKTDALEWRFREHALEFLKSSTVPDA